MLALLLTAAAALGAAACTDGNACDGERVTGFSILNASGPCPAGQICSDKISLSIACTLRYDGPNGAQQAQLDSQACDDMLARVATTRFLDELDTRTCSGGTDTVEIMTVDFIAGCLIGKHTLGCDDGAIGEVRTAMIALRDANFPTP